MLVFSRNTQIEEAHNELVSSHDFTFTFDNDFYKSAFGLCFNGGSGGKPSEAKELNNKMFKKQESKHAEFATDENLDKKRTTEIKDTAVTVSTEDLKKELIFRISNNYFPLEVFPDKIKPLIEFVHRQKEVDRAFIGKDILCATHIALGSSYRVCAGDWETALSIWACSVGLSSSGKTMSQKIFLKPLLDIQSEFNTAYQEKIKDKQETTPTRELVLHKDVTFEQLIRILANAHKGTARVEDELVKWLDDMKRYKSGASEQGFWTESWSAADSYTQERSGGKIYVIDKNNLVCSLVGTTQTDRLYRFYENDRHISGDAYRMLFAFAEKDEAISPDLQLKMPPEIYQPYYDAIKSLYFELPMDWASESKKIHFDYDAIKLFQQFQNKWTKALNSQKDNDRNFKLGVFGKIKEYILRFSASLKILDCALNGEPIQGIKNIEPEYVEKAIAIGRYFYHEGVKAYRLVRNQNTATPEALLFADTYRRCGFKPKPTYEALGISEKTFHNKRKRFLQQFPQLFNAKTKR